MRLCIIPARGGSKRIPKKNIKDFHGLPIIAYSIKTALSSKLFDEVMVSTDDKNIAEIAQLYGASVPFYRSEKSSSDFATTYDVIEEVINEYEKFNKFFDSICCIYPCAPFITSQNLENALNLLIFNNFDTVFPIVKYSTPIQRALRISDDKVKMFDPTFQKVRSQDLEASYYDSGQFYWANVKNLKENKILFTHNSGCIVVDELTSHDIDNEIDWKIAELKYSLLK